MNLTPLASKNSRYTPIRSLQGNRRRIVIRDYRLPSESRGLSVRRQVHLVLWLSIFSIIFSYRFYKWGKLESKPYVAFNNTLEAHGLKVDLYHLSEPLTPINVTRGTALVSACRNEHNLLAEVLKTWMMLPKISQIIVVDWSSTPALSYAVEELDRRNKQEYPHITILRVLNQSSWSPARSYNVAFRYASAPQILSVPCGLILRKSFISEHVLTPGYFFTGSHSLERSRDEYAFHTVLYAFRSAVESVGGYDERILSGSIVREDHIDLVSRLSQRQFRRTAIDYDSVDAEFGKIIERRTVQTRYERDLKEIEADVNIRLVSKFPEWNSTSSANAFLEDVASRDITPSFRHRRLHYVNINLTNVQQPIKASISEEQLATSRKAAVTDYMAIVYGVPECLTKLLPLPERLQLLHSVANLTTHDSAKPRTMFAIARGRLSERLLLLASSRSYSSHTGRSLFVVWPRIPQVADRFMSMSALFHSLPHSISVIENIDETMLIENGCPQFGTLNNTTALYFFSNNVSQEASTVIPAHADNMQHIIVQGNTFIKSEILRFSNPKTIRAELKDILSTTLNEDIAIKLRNANPKELSGAVGVHALLTSLNHTDTLESFSAVHKALSKSTSTFSKAYNTSTPVYINSDWKFVQRFKHLGLRVLPTLRGPSECELLTQSKCFFSEMLQIKVLTKTAKFFSPIHDSLSSFIQLYRDDGEFP